MLGDGLQTEGERLGELANRNLPILCEAGEYRAPSRIGECGKGCAELVRRHNLLNYVVYQLNG